MHRLDSAWRAGKVVNAIFYVIKKAERSATRPETFSTGAGGRMRALTRESYSHQEGE